MSLIPLLRTVPLAAVLLCLTAIPVPAQKLTFGVVAGASLTDDFGSGSYWFPGGMIPNGQTTWSIWNVTSGSRSLVIGPTLELRLPWNLSVEADALHRTLESTVSATGFFSGGSQIQYSPWTQTHASWEFPLLAKYRFPGLALHPFLEAGPSLRPAGSGTNVSHVGATAGAGVDLRFRGFEISPALRFTRWKAAGGVPTAIQNQVELLVGVSRPTESAGWAAGFGKRFSIGLLAGIALGDDLRVSNTPSYYSAGQRSDSNSPIAGILLEAALCRGLSLEANGIYRALHATDLAGIEGRDVRWAVLTWEFPVMAKYRFRASRAWRPLAELGPAFRLDGNFNGPLPSHYGVTAGAGVERRLGKLKIGPALRYTRWGKARAPKGEGTFRNEVQLLAAFAF